MADSEDGIKIPIEFPATGLPNLEAGADGLNRVGQAAQDAGEKAGAAAAPTEQLAAAESQAAEAATAQAAATKEAAQGNKELEDSAKKAGGASSTFGKVMGDLGKGVKATHLAGIAFAQFAAGDLAGGLKSAALAARAFWTALSGPFGWILAGLAAIAAAITYFVKQHNAAQKAAEDHAAAEQALNDKLDAQKDKMAALNANMANYDSAAASAQKLLTVLEQTQAAQERIQQSKDKLEDSQMALQLSQLERDRDAALKGAGGDKQKTADINFDFDQRGEAIRSKSRADRAQREADETARKAADNRDRTDAAAQGLNNENDAYAAASAGNRKPGNVLQAAGLTSDQRAANPNGPITGAESFIRARDKLDNQLKGAKPGSAEANQAKALLDLLDQYDQSLKDQAELDKKHDAAVAELQQKLNAAKSAQPALDNESHAANLGASTAQNAAASDAAASGRKAADYDKTKQQAAQKKAIAAQKQQADDDIAALEQANGESGVSAKAFADNVRKIGDLKKKLLDLGLDEKGVDAPVTPEDRRAADIAKSGVDAGTKKALSGEGKAAADALADKADKFAETELPPTGPGALPSDQTAVKGVEAAAKAVKDNPSAQNADALAKAWDGLRQAIVDSYGPKSDDAKKYADLAKDVKDLAAYVKNGRN